MPLTVRRSCGTRGIDPDAPRDPKAMIPAVTYYDMLERIAAAVDVTDLPVRSGASMRRDD